MGNGWGHSAQPVFVVVQWDGMADCFPSLAHWIATLDAVGASPRRGGFYVSSKPCGLRIWCRGWGFSSVVERLPRKRKALGSVPSSEKKNQKKKKKKKNMVSSAIRFCIMVLRGNWGQSQWPVLFGERLGTPWATTQREISLYLVLGF